MPLTWFLTTFKTDKLQNEQDQQGQQQQQQQQQHDENIYEDATTSSQRSDAHSRGTSKLMALATLISIVVIFAVLYFLMIIKDRFAIYPKNTVGLEGETTTVLSCHYVANNQRLSWLRNGVVVTLDTDVLDPSQYALETDVTGQYDLVVLNVNPGVAGQYCCAMEPADQNGYAELIYIEATPVCDVTTDLTEGEAVLVECSLGYRGKWAPVMTWTDNKDSVLTVYNVTSETDLQYRVMGIVAAAGDNGRVFTMKTYLPPPPEGAIPDNHIGNVLSVYSRTTPEYSVTFVSEPLNVSYSVRDLTIDPLQVEYQVGDTIVCSASGNPTPDVIWLDADDNVTSNVLTVTSNMMGTVSYTCQGTNTVQGVPYQKEILITFQVVDKVPYQYAGVIAGTLVAVAVLALFIWILLLKKCKFKFSLRQSTNARSGDQSNTATRNSNHRGSDLVYTVDGNVEYEYAPADAVIPNVTDPIDEEFYIEEAIEQQPVYGFAIDNIRHENNEAESVRQNAPIPGEDEESHVVEAIEEEPVYDFAVESPKPRHEEASSKGIKRGPKPSTKPKPGKKPAVSLGEIELQNVRQQLRSTKVQGSNTPESATSNPTGQENMGYMEDADDLYDEVAPHQGDSLEQGEHRRRSVQEVVKAYENQAVGGNDPAIYAQKAVGGNDPAIYAQVKTKKRDRVPRDRNQITHDNTGHVDNCDMQVPRRPIPTETHRPAETGSTAEIPRLPVDFREFEEDEGNNNTEAIYGNATIADLAISLNEAVDNPRPPRIPSRRKTDGETSDSDTSWWTDDEWSA